MKTSTLAPVAQNNRIALLDTLQGIALLGILLMNIPVFSMPDYFYWAYDRHYNDPSFWVDIVISIFFEGKMRALFSIIFGAGILLFINNKKEASKQTTWLFYRRMFWLILFGLIDAHLLLWNGDILYYYGVIGMIAFLFRKMPAKYLALATPLVAIISLGLSSQYAYDMQQTRLSYNAAVALEQKHQPVPKNLQEKKAEWEQLEKRYLPDYAEANEHTKIMQSSYTAIANYLRPRVWEGQTKYLYLGIWDPLALMLLGMALFKWGFLQGNLSRKTYIKTAWIGYLMGLPLATFNYYFQVVTFDSIEHIKAYVETHWFRWGVMAYEVQRIALVLAHVSVIVLLWQAGYAQRLWQRLAALGQMALTNYIVQAVICTLFFFGYGLGYYAHFQYYQIYYVVLAVWAVQLFYSPLWLKKFLFGPLEWLWRSLTYWQWQPMKKAVATETTSVINDHERQRTAISDRQ